MQRNSEKKNTGMPLMAPGWCRSGRTPWPRALPGKHTKHFWAQAGSMLQEVFPWHVSLLKSEALENVMHMAAGWNPLVQSNIIISLYFKSMSLQAPISWECKFITIKSWVCSVQTFSKLEAFISPFQLCLCLFGRRSWLWVLHKSSHRLPSYVSPQPSTAF